MPTLSLDALDAHPGNANVMSDEMQTKLAAHIRATGDYPPLIVRRHPDAPDRFQILDGHHRAVVLRELGHEQARCDIWEVDDARAAILLLTLNRLHGEDDPNRRGLLLTDLNESMSVEELARWVPDSSREIRALMELTQPPPALSPVPKLDDMPHAVTFFLNQKQRDRLLDRLDDISRDRSAALVQWLELDSPTTCRPTKGA